ncbi:MAG TPA: hypothetical protein DGF66_06680 [Lachnoclostridium sp.]|nr:hypothetical protein [Lachnoclostridium sp.]
MDTSQTVFIIKYESISAHVNRYPSISQPRPAPAQTTRAWWVACASPSPIPQTVKIPQENRKTEVQKTQAFPAILLLSIKNNTNTKGVNHEQ